jgi:hypothetical protein
VSLVITGYVRRRGSFVIDLVFKVGPRLHLSLRQLRSSAVIA